MITKRLVPVLLISGLTLTFVGCDLQKAAFKIFTNQGLTVLEPARDYIALGGIVILPPKGRPQYLDPYDTLPGSDGTYTNFTAVIQQQSQNQSVGIEAAVGTLASFIPVPAGLNFTTGQQVQLSQIDASGSRLTTQMVSSLLNKPPTAAAINSQLQTRNRVFLVQEIYAAKSMNLKTTSNLALAASYAGGSSLPQCGSSASGQGNASGTGQDQSTSGNKGPSTTSEQTSSSGRSASTRSQPNAVGTRGQAGSNSSSPSSNSGNQGVGISVGVCRASQYEIRFQATNAVRFAVRLVEVVSKPGNNLDLRYTNFTIPGALGAGDVSATAIVDPSYPTLEDMEHKQH